MIKENWILHIGETDFAYNLNVFIIIIIIIIKMCQQHLDFFDSLFPPIPINHHSCQVSEMASSVATELMNVIFCWSVNTSVSIYMEYHLWVHPNSSSSSCHAGSTDIPDPLSPFFPIVHCLRQVFWTTSCILT